MAEIAASRQGARRIGEFDKKDYVKSYHIILRVSRTSGSRLGKQCFDALMNELHCTGRKRVRFVGIAAFAAILMNTAASAQVGERITVPDPSSVRLGPIPAPAAAPEIKAPTVEEDPYWMSFHPQMQTLRSMEPFIFIELKVALASTRAKSPKDLEFLVPFFETTQERINNKMRYLPDKFFREATVDALEQMKYARAKHHSRCKFLFEDDIKVSFSIMSEKSRMDDFELAMDQLVYPTIMEKPRFANKQVMAPVFRKHMIFVAKETSLELEQVIDILFNKRIHSPAYCMVWEHFLTSLLAAPPQETGKFMRTLLAGTVDEGADAKGRETAFEN